MFTRRPAVLDEFSQVSAAVGGRVAFGEFFARRSSALDALGELDFFFRGKKRNAADLL